jgi:hypothetical protein
LGLRRDVERGTRWDESDLVSDRSSGVKIPSTRVSPKSKPRPSPPFPENLRLPFGGSGLELRLRLSKSVRNTNSETSLDDGLQRS